MRRSVVGITLTLALLAGDLKVAPTLAHAAAGGKSAGAILKVGMGARAAALGEAYTALGDEVFGGAYNPAALGRLGQAQVGVQHLIWFRDAAAEYAAGAYPLRNGRGVVGASVLLFRSGDLDRTFADASGDFDSTLSQGAFTTSNLVAAVSYAYTAGRPEGRPLRGAGPLRVGGTVKLVRDVVDGKAEQTVAGDVGAQATLGRSLRAGVAVANLGGKLGADPLPGAARVGLAYEGISRLKVPVEATVPFDGSRIRVGGGAEFWVRDWVAVRAGFHTGQPAAPSAGLGVAWRGLTLDYGFAWFSDALRDAHRLSLTYTFGAISKN